MHRRRAQLEVRAGRSGTLASRCNTPHGHFCVINIRIADATNSPAPLRADESDGRSTSGTESEIEARCGDQFQQLEPTSSGATEDALEDVGFEPEVMRQGGQYVQANERH